MAVLSWLPESKLFPLIAIFSSSSIHRKGAAALPLMATWLCLFNLGTRNEVLKNICN
jgi:hypothetical protein